MDYNYPHFDSPFLQGLYNWQSLIGGGIALIGAAFLWCQIRQGDKQEKERLRRRFEAAKAGMPLLLSGICSHAKEVAGFLRSIHAAAGQHAFGAPNLAVTTPVLDIQLARELQSLIEASPDNELATSLAKLLGELQVLNSRVTEIPNLGSYMTGLQLTIEDYMLQVAKVYADTSGLFGFARGNAKTVRQSEKMELRSALNLLELRDHEFERLHATAKRRFAQAG